MYMLGILFWLLMLFLIFSGFRKLIKSLFRMKPSHPDFLNLALNRDETTGQIFILLGILFFGEALLVLNRNLSGNLTFLWVLLTIIMISFITGYLLEALYPIIFGVLVMPVWWIAQSVFWTGSRGIGNNAVLSGLFLIIFTFYLAGRIFENSGKWKQTGMAVNFIAVTMLTSFLFVLSTDYGVSLFEGTRKTGLVFLSFPLTFFLFLFIVLSFSLFFFASFSKQTIFSPHAEAIPLLFLCILFTSLIFINAPVPFIYHGYQREVLTKRGILWSVFLNILSFLQLFWLLVLGYCRKDKTLINLGVLFLFFFLIFKYCFYFRFLNKSIFLIAGGVLLFLVGYFMEKGRKISLKRISGAGG